MFNINTKEIANLVYHASIISALTIGFAKLGKMLKASTPKLDFTAQDIVMTTLDIGLALATKDMLEKQGILPDEIMK